MQIRKSQFKGDRPRCPLDPEHAVHRHGTYDRLANCNDSQTEAIGRFLCYPCGHTISVLPDHRLPYRAPMTQQVEAAFDARVQHQPPPPATETETGCLNRAWTRFTQRVVSLRQTLGQMISLVKPTAHQLWKLLRRAGNLKQILRQLSVDFKISLLGDYACLKPWPRQI